MATHIPGDAAGVAENPERSRDFAGIRRAVAIFNAAREKAAKVDDVESYSAARRAWDALGVAVVDAGYYCLILDGVFYSGGALPPEMSIAAGGDDWTALVFRTALILDLDAEGGASCPAP